MHHLYAIAASLTALGLVCAIYYCNILSHPKSWVRSETLGMMLLAMFTGIFPMALAAVVIGLLDIVSNGLALTDILAAGTDLAAVAAIIATSVVFRNLVRATYRNLPMPDNVTPLTPRPTAPQRGTKPAAMAA